MKFNLSFRAIIGALYVPAFILIGLIYIHEAKPEFAVKMYHDIQAILAKSEEATTLPATIAP